MRERSLIDGFQKTRTKKSMDFHSRTNDLIRQLFE